ncbi:MAG: peptide chain release factor N(5)-glutamine methyltransferase [Treponema sp.]|nr:peptide chain release factor N(5)-glutamine methyltransferase [Treponema sp.]
MLIREAIAQGNADLKFAGIKSPGLDSSLLLAHVLKTNRTSLTARSNETLAEKHCAEFCELIERRANGECTAYITGKKEFRGLDFIVNKSVLVPRPDTETLVEAALEIINKEILHGTRTFGSPSNQHEHEIKVLDLCTGSGAVAVALKNEMPELEVYASDISAEALETAKQNAEKLLGSNKINFYHGDLFDALPAPYSIIASNPPYIPSNEIETLQAEVQNEPHLALDGGSFGLEIIKRIIDNAPKFLKNGGWLLMEADPRQMNEITILLDKKGFNGIKLYKDLSGSNRVIGGRFDE